MPFLLLINLSPCMKPQDYIMYQHKQHISHTARLPDQLIGTGH